MLYAENIDVSFFEIVFTVDPQRQIANRLKLELIGPHHLVKQICTNFTTPYL